MSEAGNETVDDSVTPDPVARLAFVMNVHNLILLGFERVKDQDFHDSEEEDITGVLTEAIDGVLEDPDVPEWAIHIAIHEEKRKSDGERLGKKRLRLDFEFERTGRGRRPRFVIEAKRLGPNHSVGGAKGYLGTAGMGAFLSGEYATEHSDGGMLGYMQSHTPEHWREQLATKLGVSPGEYAIELEGEWQATHIADCPLVLHQTTHSRTVGRSPITIYHTILDFRAPVSTTQ